MKSILYLYRTTMKNRLRKSFKKPVTYLYVLCLLGFVIMGFTMYGQAFQEWKLDTPEGMTAIFTVFTFWMLPANLISYAKRKGLVFLKSDIHFIFPSPLNPKLILFYAHAKTMVMTIVVNLLLVFAGVFWFHIVLWKMLIYFLFACIVEYILEASLMVLLYGSEKLGTRGIRLIQILMYGLIGLFLLIGAYTYFANDLSMDTVIAYLHSPLIQGIPIIGWYIGFLHLLFMGPTAMNIVVSILYFIAAAVLLVMAVKMSCEGAYYEDAMKFADDYEEARKRNRKGEAVVVIGKKKRFKTAAVSYKGSCAKAIFYRQLLEYKKSRFFMFGFPTLLCAAIGILLAFLIGRDSNMGMYGVFIIPGVMAYLVFLLTNTKTKWGRELEMPYTYLIPDSAFRKLWYATLMEHIRSVVEGALLTIPSAVVMGISLLQMILCILIYVCLQACKLYVTVMAEALLGNIIGAVGKQFFRLLLMGIVIGSGIIGAIVGITLGSIEWGYLLMIGITVLMTAAFMVVASGSFERMETVD